MGCATPAAMRLGLLRVGFSILGIIGLQRAAFAAGAEPRVSDGGVFFSREALSEAEDVIRLIRRAFDRDVVVETYAAIPEELKDDLARDGKEKFYENWLNRRAKVRGVRGVFVLMTREPGRVQVGVDRPTRRRLFTVDDRETLRGILASAFRARQFDRGLLEGVRFVRLRMAQNSAGERDPTVPVGTAPVVASTAGTSEAGRISR